MIRRLDIPALGLPSTLSTGGRSGQGGQWWTACGIRKEDCDDVAENDYIYTIKSDFMASNPDFVQYITDQCAGAGEIAVKKMMGDYFYISDVDDRDYLVALIKATLPALPRSKSKKSPMK